MGRVDGLIKLAKRLYRKSPQAIDDWSQSVFGKSNNVANNVVGTGVKRQLAEDIMHKIKKYGLEYEKSLTLYLEKLYIKIYLIFQET